MSESVKIVDGVEEYKQNEGVSLKNKAEVGKVVPLSHANREGSVDRIQITKGGESTHDGVKGIQVSAPTRTGHEGAIGTIRNAQDTLVGDLSKVTDDCSIEIGGTRCRIDVAIHSGLVVRDEDGKLAVVEHKATEEQARPKAVENMNTKEHQDTLNQLNSRTSPAVTDAFLTKITSRDPSPSRS